MSKGGILAQSFFDEWAAMFSGHFVPYHKLAVLVALITSFFFSITFSHDIVFEAPVAVIDLDASRYSAQFIEKLNASPYISVREVLHSPADPRKLTRHDRVQGVLYLPHGLAESVIRGDKTVRVGFFADDSNTAQNGEIFNVLNEVVASEGASVSVSRAGGVGTLAQNEPETESTLSPLRVVTRYLSNPTGQAATGTVVNFLFFFSMMYLGMTCLMLPGRLRVTHRWAPDVLSGSVLALLVRVVPYALICTAAVSTALAVLINLGQLRFAGNGLLFVVLLFLCAVANGWVALLLAWRCSTPGDEASFMIWLVPPGFILGGATMAIGFAQPWMQFLSKGIPLVRLFSFWRDVGLRGLEFSAVAASIGWFLLYLVFLGVLVGIRFRLDERRRRKEVRAFWRELAAAGPAKQPLRPLTSEKAAR